MLRQTQKPKRNPRGAGRKTAFHEKFHDEIIEHMSKGYSVNYFASKIKVSKQTVYNWIRENPEFKESFEIATTASQAYWESLALNNAKTAKGNGNQIQYQMSKRFRDDYGDTSSINIFNSNNQNNNKSVTEMTREELEAYENELRKSLIEDNKNDN
ncbi:helix-turn-helix domain-containing protein [Fluviispira vulneris]|uniref:helix-turn-helix domain-containing protein n=1 Tax=Fluviispira vulneris TaxID=2763012 RepID=UPI0016465EA1|nr:helix-turn-helix domain-containing protein [Fluviispira vulneris]